MVTTPPAVDDLFAIRPRRMPGWRSWIRVVLAGLAGALLVLAFPPYGWWPLSVLMVASLILLIRDQTLWWAALIGGVYGLTFFLGLMPWLRIIGPDAWLLLSLMEAVFLALFGTGAALLTRNRWWPLTTALLWVAMEALRDRFPFGGVPWGRLAFANSESTFTGWASIGGAPVVTFAVALAGGILAWLVVSPPRNWKWFAISVTVIVLVSGSGAVIPRPTNGPTVVAAVVQGNVPRTGMDAFGQRAAVLSGHVVATHELADEVAKGAQPQPDLVIWPENSSDIDPANDADAYAQIDGAVRAIDAPTLVGIVTKTPDQSHLLNVGVVWSPTAGPGERYIKRHPVPFGEYVPLRGLLSKFISRFDRIPEDFAAGDQPGVLQLGSTTVGDVICFEVAFDGVVRDVVSEGASIITVQTNNATYGRTGQVEQQLALSQLRAVEHGRSVLVAATSGISAIIAPDGTIEQRTDEFTRKTLLGDVVTRTELTIATRVGAWPEWIITVLAIVALILAVRRRSQSHA